MSQTFPKVLLLYLFQMSHAGRKFREQIYSNFLFFIQMSLILHPPSRASMLLLFSSSMSPRSMQGACSSTSVVFISVFIHWEWSATMINSSKAPRSTSKRKRQGFPRETCRTAFQSERNPNSKDCFIKLELSLRHIDYCPHSSVVHLITDVKSKSLSDDNMPRCSEPDQRRWPDQY